MRIYTSVSNVNINGCKSRDQDPSLSRFRHFTTRGGRKEELNASCLFRTNQKSRIKDGEIQLFDAHQLHTIPWISAAQCSRTDAAVMKNAEEAVVLRLISALEALKRFKVDISVR